MNLLRNRFALYTAIVLVLAALPGAAAPPAAPWTTQDIGGPSRKGSCDVGAEGVWTLKGGGADIWDASDQFSFTYQPVEGDVQITVKALTKPKETNEWAKAGVMFRESLMPGARHAMLLTSASSGLAFQWRAAAGAESEWPDAATIESDLLKLPLLLRLTRRGKTITAEYSTDDGKTFQSAGDPLTFAEDLPKTVYVGLAVTAHDDEQLTEATFQAPKIEKPTAAPAARAEIAPDEPITARVDRLFARWDRPDSPGCALAVVRDGGVIYSRGYGRANLEYDVPITPATIFHVASVSKQFTAMAAILLAGDGKLSLDDDVRKYLPEVPDFGKKITLRHLIYHTSGLRDQWNLLILAGWRMEDVITERDILDLVQRQKELNFEPGAEHSYCNTGYTLLALVVQRVTGQSLREFAEARIFQPLGMKNTHFHDDHRRVVKNRAYSYAPKRGGGYEHSVLSYANVGATSLFTTAEDLALWDRNFEDARVGGSAALAEMLRKGTLNDGTALNYAGALVIGEYKGLRTVEHGGADAGYRSIFSRFPDQRFSVILLSNLATFSPDGMASRVADLYLADQLKPGAARPPSPPAATVDPRLLEVCAGQYQIFPGMVLTLEKDKERLMVQANGGRKLALAPQSETEFGVRGADARLTVERNGSGTVRRITLHQGGRASPARRVRQAASRPDMLEAYAGDYYSDELGVIYTVALRDGKLYLRHRKGEELLRPAFVDAFSCDLGNITFTRDRRNRADGFLVDTGRVRHLRFARTARRVTQSLHEKG